MGCEADFRPLIAPDRGDRRGLGSLFAVSDRFLRRAARRWLTRGLRQRFDSGDVAQAVWAGLIDAGVTAGQFPTPEHFRAFLVRAVRNRVIDWARRHRAASAADHPAPADRSVDEMPASAPRPSEEARADDLWEQLLAHCPPEHRPVLTFRRAGLSLAEVAARTGFHEGSVRRILRGLARRVAFSDPQ